MKPLTSMQHHLPRPALCGALFATLTVAILLPAARGQGDQTGGPGTIDPSTIATREIVNDTTLIEDPHEALSARYVGVDAAGNFYVGSTAIRSDYPAPRFRNAISKYSPAGALVWRHEGAATDDFNAPMAPADPDQPYTQMSGLSVNAAGDVVVAFDTLTYNRDGSDYNVDPGALIVSYDPNGLLRWRDLTGGTTATVPPNAHTQVQSVTATTDGGALVLLDNFNYDTGSAYPRRSSIVVRFGPDGAERFTDVFGTAADDLVVIPLLVADDGAGNAFLLTREARYEDGPPGLIGIGTDVIRRLDSSGSLAVRKDATADESKTDAWVDARTDSAGNLYIAGNYLRPRTSATSGDGASGQLVLAYNPDLTLRWRALGPQPAQAAEEQPTVEVRAMRLSPGGITLGGTTLSDALEGSGDDRHWEVTRFAYADGAVQWHRLYQAATAGDGRFDTVTNLQVDMQDNVYAVGYRSASPRNEVVLIKYSAVGDTQFIKLFPTADQLVDPGSQSFQLAGDDRPAFVSPVGGKSLVVLVFDNPAVVPATGTTHPAFFNGEVALGQGVYYLKFPGNGNIFGYYEYLSDPRFIYHFDLGFEYCFDSGDGSGSIYFYDFASQDFFYTSPTFSFPYLYDFNLKAFLYYYPDPTNPQRYNSNGVRYFYNFSTKQIISR